VLVALADFADEKGSCWPSLSTLKKRTNLCERAIRTALRMLEENKLLITSHRDGSSSRYFLALDLENAPWGPEHSNSGKPRQEMPGGTTCRGAPRAGLPGRRCRTPRQEMPDSPAPRAP
jgi:hypothetical protein